MTLVEKIRDWLLREGAWWTTSFVFHMFLICMLLLLGAKAVPKVVDQAPAIEEAQAEAPPPLPSFERYEVGETPQEPGELTSETLILNQAPLVQQAEQINDDSPVFSERGGGRPMEGTGPQLGGLGGFDFKAVGPGPAVRGKGGVGVGVGFGTGPGAGGDGIGFGGRGAGMRKALVGSFGGTKQSERSVAAALNWLARHQLPDGSWSLEGYTKRCKDPSCSGSGSISADSAATALALLPFLAAGQTHQTKGPYKGTISSGLSWLLRSQQRNGDLRGNSTMYAHGLAAITLCEAYGLSGDKVLGQAAQQAVNFIQAAQNPTTGGWRYQPGQEGDTSVVGWQVMALKSAQMARLDVSPAAFDGTRHFLQSVASGYQQGLFSYLPGGDPKASMTAVGLLCYQYLQVKRDDPAMVEGTKSLMRNLPDNYHRDVYYWYYATQVMHNLPGPDWDTWNRQMRRVLIETQVKENCCALGSWAPMQPSKDRYGERAGRLYMTSLAALTLEVYYRYLPLYRLDTEAAAPAPVAETTDSSEGIAAPKAAAKTEASAAEADRLPAADQPAPAAEKMETPAAQPAEAPAAEKHKAPAKEKAKSPAAKKKNAKQQ